MGNLTLIIGNKNYSSWSLRPWIFLRHNEIAFEEKRVALFTETTEQALSPYNSDFKVPVLIDGGMEIWDSLSILEYISEKYLDFDGWPRELEARAVARSVSCEMHSSYPNLRNELPMNCRKKFENTRLSTLAEREVERVRELWRQCRTQFGNKGEWLFGRYTIADAMFAPVVLRFYGYSIPLGAIEQAYVRSVLSQQGIVEWIEAGKVEREVISEDEIMV